MGLIRKCDKCRKYFRENDEHPYNEIHLWKRGEKFIWILCDECVGAFDDWIRGRTTRNLIGGKER